VRCRPARARRCSTGSAAMRRGMAPRRSRPILLLPGNTGSTRRAMAAFMERVNASLPLDQPDYILLALVKGHTGIACGAECPTVQVAAANGQFLPQAVVARAIRKSQQPTLRAERRAHDAEVQTRLAAESLAAQASRAAEARMKAVMRPAAGANGSSTAAIPR